MHEFSYLYASADTITIVTHILFKTLESKKLLPCNIKGMIHEKKLTSWTSLKLKISSLRHCQEDENISHTLEENIFKGHI